MKGPIAIERECESEYVNCVSQLRKTDSPTDCQGPCLFIRCGRVFVPHELIARTTPPLFIT